VDKQREKELRLALPNLPSSKQKPIKQQQARQTTTNHQIVENAVFLVSPAINSTECLKAPQSGHGLLHGGNPLPRFVPSRRAVTALTCRFSGNLVLSGVFHYRGKRAQSRGMPLLLMRRRVAHRLREARFAP